MRVSRLEWNIEYLAPGSTPVMASASVSAEYTRLMRYGAAQNVNRQGKGIWACLRV